ncbi:MAG: SRPBCC family protein [Gammaproteobacteria bacterium]|nr:SRPBCC family protein [Gammaproteobacteria bacterium]
MSLSVSDTINAPREIVWSIITDLDGAQEIVSAITDLQVLERPDSGILGLKWQETRIMFGKEATETMWISDADIGHWYETTAENHGMIYHSKLALEESGEQTELSMSFVCKPQTLSAKIFSVFSFLFNGTVRKAFAADLHDIKVHAEMLARNQSLGSAN